MFYYLIGNLAAGVLDCGLANRQGKSYNYIINIEINKCSEYESEAGAGQREGRR